MSIDEEVGEWGGIAEQVLAVLKNSGIEPIDATGLIIALAATMAYELRMPKEAFVACATAAWDFDNPHNEVKH